MQNLVLFMHEGLVELSTMIFFLEPFIPISDSCWHADTNLITSDNSMLKSIILDAQKDVEMHFYILSCWIQRASV